MQFLIFRFLIFLILHKDLSKGSSTDIEYSSKSRTGKKISKKVDKPSLQLEEEVKKYEKAAKSLTKKAKKLVKKASGPSSIMMKIFVGKAVVEEIKAKVKKILYTTERILKKTNVEKEIRETINRDTKTVARKIIEDLTKEKEEFTILKLELGQALKKANKLPAFGKNKLRGLIEDMEKFIKIWEKIIRLKEDL